MHNIRYNIIGDIHGRKCWKELIKENCTNIFVGDYLIDDRPEKNGAGDFEGEVIAIGSEQFPNWDAVLKYLKL